jgi:hypothetical protein
VKGITFTKSFSRPYRELNDQCGLFSDNILAGHAWMQCSVLKSSENQQGQKIREKQIKMFKNRQ